MNRSALRERVPLPVREVVRHKPGERRMLHVEPRSKRRRRRVRDGKPARAPVDALELAFRRLEARAGVKDRLPLPERGLHRRHVVRLHCAHRQRAAPFSRIHPEVPFVAPEPKRLTRANHDIGQWTFDNRDCLDFAGRNRLGKLYLVLHAGKFIGKRSSGLQWLFRQVANLQLGAVRLADDVGETREAGEETYRPPHVREAGHAFETGL